MCVLIVINLEKVHIFFSILLFPFSNSADLFPILFFIIIFLLVFLFIFYYFIISILGGVSGAHDFADDRVDQGQYFLFEQEQGLGHAVASEKLCLKLFKIEEREK